jgi:predicted O-linked N-acetylglucosamine transferase (SPINDLY family)
MGVPVVALLGDRHAARVSGSLLHAGGFGDWVAAEPADFSRIAAALVADRPALERLRTAMRDRLRASPLLDGRAYAQRVFAALETLRMRA